MSYRSVFYVVGKILVILGTLLFLPFFVAVYYNYHGFHEGPFIYQSFLIPSFSLIIFGYILQLFKPKKISIYAREGFVICGISWFLMSIFGAMPFYLSHCIPNFMDAFFETASGFTTTGSTILKQIEGLPKSILFWRSFTHWIGGMGILTFMIAVLPRSQGNSMNLMKAEVPGPKASKVRAKISQSAQILYIIYIALTLIEMAVLFFGSRISGDRLRLYDCVVNAFSNAGTGGFAVLNNSILGYHSKFVEWTIIVFMFLFGTNFNLIYFLLLKNFKSVFRDEEFRAYVLINVSSVALITLNIMKMYNHIGDAIRDSFFVVNATMSTTGFGTADFDKWPTFSKMLVIMLMFVGGCVGSTGGGIKVSRIVVYFKQTVRDFKQMLHPNHLVKVKMNGRRVDGEIIKGLNSYLVAYILTMIVSMLLLSFNGFDMTTTASAVITCLNNVGPGLELVGPTQNFALFSNFSKLVLIFDMLAGRLELFPILLLLFPKTWKKS